MNIIRIRDIGFLLCLGTALIVATGCATSTTGKLAQTEGVLIPSVNASMGTWKAYVDAGKATQAQIDAVQAAYNVYYTAQLHAQAALIASATGTNVTDQATAQAAVTAAQTQVTTLVTQYTK